MRIITTKNKNKNILANILHLNLLPQVQKNCSLFRKTFYSAIVHIPTLSSPSLGPSKKMPRPRRFNFLGCENPFDAYREDEFAQTFGFRKDNVNAIVEMVKDALEVRIERKTVLSPEKKVLIFLDYIRSRVLGKKRHSGTVLFLLWVLLHGLESNLAI